MFKVLVALLLLTFPAYAQQLPGLTMDFANQPDGTINSKDQLNILPTQTVSLFCMMIVTRSSGNSPTATYKIQAKGADMYIDLLTSPVVSTLNTPTLLVMGPGVKEVANVSTAMPVPPAWRISLTVTKTTGAVSVDGKLRCKVQ